MRPSSSPRPTAASASSAQALEAGAHDVLALPLQRGELHKALLRATQATPRTPAAPESLGEVITVYGARGGLGATTVAVNLASGWPRSPRPTRRSSTSTSSAATWPPS